MIALINKALSVFGLKELSGSKHNEQIVEFFNVSGHSWVKNDETAWCSAFVNWVCIESGFEASKKLNARSWLDVGAEIETPRLGDIVIFWRESKSSWKGHVGFFIREEGENVFVLGGNQSNGVNIKPYSKARVLGYRRVQIIDKAKGLDSTLDILESIL